MRSGKSVLRVILALALLASVASAAEVLTQGVDVWETATGFTWSSFGEDPIPAGFFCPGSKPFTGMINLHGKPLATQPEGRLGKVDTIVRRLGDAVLADNGEGSVPIQLMALSLASVTPIETECGRYDVTVGLDGEQPTTEMKLVKTSDQGGYYVAPLELNVKLTFVPVEGQGPRRELATRISLGPGSASVWSKVEAAQPAVQVKVDTDNDGVAETVLPGPSNFRVGVAPAATSSDVELCPDKSCHCAKLSKDPYTPNWYCKHLHCVEVLVDCSKPVEEIRYGPIPEESEEPASSSF